jgi:hypothetical protein
MKGASFRPGRIILAVGLVALAAVPVAWSLLPKPLRSNSVSMPAAFAAEVRDDQWAHAMEDRLRDSITPTVAAREGARLVDVECRSRSCWLSLAVTPELKAKLNRSSIHGVGFATDRVLNESGPLAPRVHALFDGHESSLLERTLRSLRLARAESAAMRWRLARLERENYIFAFDDSNRDLVDQARWNTKVLENIRAHRGS